MPLLGEEQTNISRDASHITEQFFKNKGTEKFFFLLRGAGHVRRTEHYEQEYE